MQSFSSVTRGACDCGRHGAYDGVTVNAVEPWSMFNTKVRSAPRRRIACLTELAR
jgi:hypothetical protein